MTIKILMNNISLGVLQDMLGAIPMIVSATEQEETVAERIAIGYAHGGGYNPMTGWSFEPVKKPSSLQARGNSFQ